MNNDRNNRMHFNEKSLWLALCQTTAVQLRVKTCFANRVISPDLHSPSQSPMLWLRLRLQACGCQHRDTRPLDPQAISSTACASYRCAVDYGFATARWNSAMVAVS